MKVYFTAHSTREVFVVHLEKADADYLQHVLDLAKGDHAVLAGMIERAGDGPWSGRAKAALDRLASKIDLMKAEQERRRRKAEAALRPVALVPPPAPDREEEVRQLQKKLRTLNARVRDLENTLACTTRSKVRNFHHAYVGHLTQVLQAELGAEQAAALLDRVRVLAEASADQAEAAAAAAVASQR